MTSVGPAGSFAVVGRSEKVSKRTQGFRMQCATMPVAGGLFAYRQRLHLLRRGDDHPQAAVAHRGVVGVVVVFAAAEMEVMVAVAVALVVAVAGVACGSPAVRFRASVFRRCQLGCRHTHRAADGTPRLFRRWPTTTSSGLALAAQPANQRAAGAFATASPSPKRHGSTEQRTTNHKQKRTHNPNVVHFQSCLRSHVNHRLMDDDSPE